MAEPIPLKSVRTAESVVDEVVVPAPAMLMREYRSARMPEDAFFCE